MQCTLIQGWSHLLFESLHQMNFNSMWDVNQVYRAKVKCKVTKIYSMIEEDTVTMTSTHTHKESIKHSFMVFVVWSRTSNKQTTTVSFFKHTLF